jgi:predicted PurR-regulated permease PerM
MGSTARSVGEVSETTGAGPVAAPGTEAMYAERVIALTLLLVLLLGCVLVLRPFLPALLWAAILAVSTWPLYMRLEHVLGGRRSLAALIMIVAVAAVLLVPVTMLGLHLTAAAGEAEQTTREWLASGLPPLPGWLYRLPLVGPRIQDFWTRVANDQAALAAAVQPYIGDARDWLIALGGDLLQGIVQVVISLLVAFFFYRDGRATVDMLSRIGTRLTGQRSGRLLHAAGNTINGVVQGVLGTSLVQAVLLGIGLHLAGVPAAILLGFVSFFLSLLPAALILVWLPAVIWLSSQGASTAAIFMAVWGIFVGTLDNWLRPLLILKQSELPLILILLGVFGGALVFGLLGIFLGPVLLAVGQSLLREWGAAAAPGYSDGTTHP